MHSDFWNNQNILITGGGGFIGSHVTQRLSQTGARLTVASRTGQSKLGHALPGDRLDILRGDLREAEFADRCTRGQDIVFHFASKIAGLGYNAQHPAEMMAYNTLLDLQVINAAARNRVPLFFYPSGALVYDRDAPNPITESTASLGPPIEACKGATWAKRTCEIALDYFREEFGMQPIVARLSNLYGPGDDFDPETAHLIGNTIRLVAQGEAPEIWGDGSQWRSYLYVSEAVAAVLALVENHSKVSGPVNIGGQHEVTVRELVQYIIEISGKTLRPRFHPEHPQGMKRKVLNIQKFLDLTDFKESVPLRKGLQETYDWFVAQANRPSVPKNEKDRQTAR